jgi:hypothetical protein
MWPLSAYNFAPGWMAAVTGLGSVTPFFDHRLEVLCKPLQLRLAAVKP